MVKSDSTACTTLPASTYPVDQHDCHLPRNLGFESIDPGQALLERYTVEILEALNAGDFTAPALDRLSPDLKTDLEIVEGQAYPGRNAADFIRKHINWLKRVPTRTFRVVDYSSAFDGSMGRADVWVSLKITGWKANRAKQFNSEYISCFKWRRSEGVWWCRQHTGIGGVIPLQFPY